MNDNDKKQLLRQKIQSLSVFAESEIEKPEPLLMIGGYLGFTVGRISSTQGAKNSGKSILVSSIIRAFVRGEFINFKATTSRKTKILLIDTEQGEHELQKRIIRADVNCQNENVFVQSLDFSGESVNDRNSMLDLICEEMDFDLVILDGGRQFVTSVNDEKEVGRHFDKLKKICKERKIHFHILIHENKGNGFTRGHYGTELDNVSERQLRICYDRDINIFSVSCEKSRNDRFFDDFFFYLDDNVLPVLCDEPVKEEKGKRAKKESGQKPSKWKETDEKKHIANCHIVLQSGIKDPDKFKKSLSEIYNISTYHVSKAKDNLFDYLIKEKFLQVSISNTIIKGLKFKNVSIPFQKSL